MVPHLHIYTHHVLAQVQAERVGHAVLLLVDVRLQHHLCVAETAKMCMKW